LVGLTKKDDYMHTASENPDWRESWYFNWVDLNAQICGFSTVAILPNLPKREFVLALFIKGVPRLYLAEPKEPVPKIFDAAMSDGKLSYKLITPFDEWQIDFASRQFRANIRWQKRFPAYDFGSGSGVTWERHFEQSGQVTGTIEFPDGSIYTFQGLGQRDKSWGIRNWHIDRWFHLMAQFDDFMIGFRQDVIQGKEYISGCICSNDEIMPVTNVKVRTELEEEPIRKPIRGHYYIEDKKGRHYNLTSQLIGPLTFARYSRQFSGGETELFEEMVIYKYEEENKIGAGLAEYIFTHPTSRKVKE
jgi:hypothetical protein